MVTRREALKVAAEAAEQSGWTILAIGLAPDGDWRVEFED